MIIQVIDQRPFSKNYCPSIVEVFDQYGLLSGRIHGCFSYESTRNPEQESEFTAWLLDGELAVGKLHLMARFRLKQKMDVVSYLKKLVDN